MDGKCLELTLTFYQGLSHCHSHAPPYDIRALYIHSHQPLPIYCVSETCVPKVVPLLFLYWTSVFECACLWVRLPVRVSLPRPDTAPPQPPSLVSCLALEKTWKSKRACQCNTAHSYLWLFTCRVHSLLNSALRLRCCTAVLIMFLQAVKHGEGEGGKRRSLWMCNILIWLKSCNIYGQCL